MHAVLGTDGDDVTHRDVARVIEVQDIEPEKVLSYTWMGNDNDANREKARAALDAALTKKNITPKSYRLLGYNGPGTPKKKRTWELQAVID